MELSYKNNKQLALKGILIVAFLALVILISITSTNTVYVFFALSGIIFLIFTARRYPIVLISTLLVTGALPNIFLMLDPSDDLLAIGGGINLVDVTLMAMVIAVIYEFPRRISKKNTIPLNIYLFVILLVYEIVRNIPSYGLSAPGEFRYRYFILIIPVFIVVFFDTPLKRRKLFTVLVKFSVFVTLLCVPIIGMIKGWKFGSDDRFLPAHATLGMVYGIVAIMVARKYQYIRFEGVFLWLLLLPIIILVLLDSHRSVWLAIGVISFFFINDIRRYFLSFAPWLLIAIVVWLIISSMGFNLYEYITTRAIAFINPEEDTTSAWRLIQWKAQIEKFLAQPIFGEGLGGYWEVYVPEFDKVMDVQPHSFYVQTLVKLGALGLILYLSIVVKQFLRVKNWLKLNPNSAEFPLVILAYIFFMSSHAYYIVYSLEYFTLLFIGLGLAVVIHTNDELNYV